MILFAAAALLCAVSCGKSGQPTPAQDPAAVQSGTSESSDSPVMEDSRVPGDPLSDIVVTGTPQENGRILVRAGENTPSPDKMLSMDFVEHKLLDAGQKYAIEVAGQKGKGQYEPDIKAIYDAIVEVFPLPMLVQWAWYGADAPGIWDREAEIFIDREHFFLGGVWKDPMGDFDDHFELKAWQVNAGTWTVGLNYQPTWDGDDGIGIYGRQLFWSYGPFGDATLYPIPSDENCPQPVSDTENPYFDRTENTVSFPDAFDPAGAKLYWNGWWFEHRN